MVPSGVTLVCVWLGWFVAVYAQPLGYMTPVSEFESYVDVDGTITTNHLANIICTETLHKGYFRVGDWNVTIWCEPPNTPTKSPKSDAFRCP